MFKKLLTVITILLFTFQLAYSQGSVSGTVTDARTGESLPGVSVVLTEIQRGASTNIDGEYTISDVPSGSYTLRASFVGYRTFETTVDVGTGEVVQNISMRVDVLGLDDVVVTALGFEANADQSGNSSSRVSGEAIAGSGETNVVSGLSAKTAGVNIVSTSGDPGAASRILIRGANTISGDNEPLFIVDGVPVFNSSIGTGVAGVAQQSRINDLNPDDIESVRILKGPSAAAVWGSRAANGVVIIETKTGQAVSGEKKVAISFTSNVSFDELNKTQDLQTKFGQGFGGAYGFGSAFSYGDKIANRSGGADVMDTSPGNAYIGPDGETYGVITEKNSRETFDHSRNMFQTGLKLDNSLSISGGDENGTFYLSASHLNQEGIILDNSNYERTAFRANTTRYFDKLTTTVNAAYSKVEADRIQQGSNVSGLLLGGYRTAPDFDNSVYTVDYISADGSIIPDRHRSYRNPIGAGITPIYDNPRWTIENVNDETSVNRLSGSTELSYDASSSINVTHRLGLDYYSDRRNTVFPIYAAGNPTGALTEQTLSQFQINSDLIARASHTFNNDISGSALIGWNINQRNFDNLGASSSDIILSTFPRDVSNYISKNPFQSRSTVRTSALYAVLNFTLYDQLFLELTGRSESASTFGPDTDNTFFYPSASLAWQFSELDAFDDLGWLSFGKLRASYGEAGIQPGPYNTSTNFFQGAFTSSWGDGLNPEAYGGGFARTASAGNPRLQVERTSEFEIGTDLRFFDDRLNLGLTYYQTETTDAILPVTRPPSSGFSSQVANAASLENKGFEAEVEFEAVRSRDFSWIITGNWSKNNNEVTSLAGADEVGLAGFTGSTSSAVVGEPYGVLFGGQWRRASQFPLSSAEEADGFTVGNEGIILNPTGFRVQADAEGVVGDPNADWRAGIGSTINYKNASLSLLVDIKQGGDVWNGTKGALYYFGRSADQTTETTITAEQAGELVNVFGESPSSAADYATYTQNGDGGYTFRGTVQDFGAGPVIIDDSYYWGGPGSGFTGPFEQFIEDGSYVRLREVGVSYNFNSASFREFTGLSSMSIAAKGRNLLLFTDYSGIDPETNLTGASNGFGLDYFQNPNTRSWFFTLKINY
ncbi:SusC/RagA family TonB-linked outer membrane protein [Rhodohalobacter sp. 8-1]|uniref:SusC/RagA family TonB-linked outer membrane protein n=1 Tax=Rhodohalobacter sp. 8-1 TaxID=3131972 RepID=UPI0030EEE94E